MNWIQPKEKPQKHISRLNMIPEINSIIRKIWLIICDSMKGLLRGYAMCKFCDSHLSLFNILKAARSLFLIFWALVESLIENGLDETKLSLNGWNGNVCFWMELVRFTVNRYFVLIRFAPTPIYDEVFWVCFRIQIETSIVRSTESLDEKEITDCLWTAQYKRSRLNLHCWLNLHFNRISLNQTDTIRPFFWPNQWPWFIHFLELTQKKLINRL